MSQSYLDAVAARAVDKRTSASMAQDAIRQLRPLRLCMSQDERSVWSLLLETGTAADDAVSAIGLEASSSLWESVATYVLHTDATLRPELVELDAEEGRLVAFGQDRPVLAGLGAQLARVANDGAALVELIQRGRANGFEFDD